MTSLTPLQIATRNHRNADMLQAMAYKHKGDHFRGCSVGCLAHDLEPKWGNEDILMLGHAAVAEHYDYPEWLVYLQDAVFEGLPEEHRADWHVSVADAIAERGRDWQIVMHAVHAAILRVALRTAGSAAGVVQAVIDLHEAALRGEPQDDVVKSATAASAARSVARNAAKIATEIATESAAESAAWIAAESAAWSAAESAAWSAAESAAWSAAWSATGAAYQEIAAAILKEIRRQ